MKRKKMALLTAVAVSMTGLLYWDTSAYFSALGTYKKEKIAEKISERNERFAKEAFLVWNCGSVDVANNHPGPNMDRECFLNTLPQLQDSRSIVSAIVRVSDWLKLHPHDAVIAEAAYKALDVAWRDAANRAQLLDQAVSVTEAANTSLVSRVFRVMPTVNDDCWLDLTRAEAALAAPGISEKISDRLLAFARDANRVKNSHIR